MKRYCITYQTITGDEPVTLEYTTPFEFFEAFERVLDNKFVIATTIEVSTKTI